MSDLSTFDRTRRWLYTIIVVTNDKNSDYGQPVLSG